MFKEGTKVSYMNMKGVIDFIGPNYLVIELNESENRSPARLLVYRQNYFEIKECGD